MTQDRNPTNRDHPQPNDSTRSQVRQNASGGLVSDAIGRSLQAHFDDIASTPVPDKFLLLLAELEAKESRSES